jgi:Flp pilus assembly pilin Flp
MTLLTRMWTEDDGVLSFEWTLLLTLLAIGIVAGLAGARDAIIDELGDVAQAAQAIDQSYSLEGFTIPGLFSSAGSEFTESPADQVFEDCARANAPVDQTPQAVSDLPS